MNSQIIFFIGKGGVGKSTISALTALNSSNINKKTLLVSLDPAHNQRDIFKQKFSEKATEIKANLFIIEVNIDKRIKEYLKNSSQKIQNNYNYQSAFSLKNYFKLLKHSPSIEEYAMLNAFEDIILKHNDKEFIIFDMPPTALSLRFFGLPKTSMIWLKQLSELRNAINKKKEIISKVKFGKKEIETDKVKNQLSVLMKQHIAVNKLFSANSTNINIVLNNDYLSVNESIRLDKKLEDLELKTSNFIVNKSTKSIINTKETEQFADKININIPNSSEFLSGIDRLNAFISKYLLKEKLLKIITREENL